MNKGLRLEKCDCRRGAPMGRQTQVPRGATPWPKLRLQRLDMTDCCYDRGGAYWGSPGPAGAMYVAFSAQSTFVRTQGWKQGDEKLAQVQIFFRARSREEAKREIKIRYPEARFYR